MIYQELFSLLSKSLTLYSSFGSDFFFISENVTLTPSSIASLTPDLTLKSQTAAELSLKYIEILKEYNNIINPDTVLIELNDITEKFIITNQTLASSLLNVSQEAEFSIVTQISSAIELTQLNKVLYGNIASIITSPKTPTAEKIVNNITNGIPYSVYLQSLSITISALGCLLALKSSEDTDFNKYLGTTAQASAAAIDNLFIL